jgi:hypothetical protein
MNICLLEKMEEFRKIKSGESYGISCHGNVKSTFNGKIKMVKTSGGTYKRKKVKIYSSKTEYTERYVDELVCEVFFPLTYNGQNICHKDGNIGNCHKGNLSFKVTEIDEPYYIYFELENPTPRGTASI